MLSKVRLTSDLVKDLVWTFSSQLLIMLIVLIVNKMVSIHLGIEGFALYSIIKKSSTVLAALFVWGMTISLPRYLSLYRVSKDEREPFLLPSSIIILFSLLAICLIVSILFPSVMKHWVLGGLGDIPLLWVVIFYSFAFAFNDIVVAVFRGKSYYKRSNIVQIVTQLSLLCGVIFFHEVTSMFLSWGGLILLSCSLFIGPFLWRDMRFSHIVQDQKSIVPVVKSLLRYGTPRMFSDLLYQLTSFVPLLIVLSKFGEIATGLFSTAITLQLMITPLFAFTGQIFLQRISEMVASKDFLRIRRSIRISMIIFILIASLGVVILSIGADFWVSMLFAEEFLPASSLVVIVALSLIPRAIYILLRNPLDAVSEVPYNLYTLLIWFAIYIISLYSVESIEMSAWCYTLSSCSLALTSIFFWRRSLCKYN